MPDCCDADADAEDGGDDNDDGAAAAATGVATAAAVDAAVAAVDAAHAVNDDTVNDDDEDDDDEDEDGGANDPAASGGATPAENEENILRKLCRVVEGQRGVSQQRVRQGLCVRRRHKKEKQEGASAFDRTCLLRLSLLSWRAPARRAGASWYRRGTC